MTTLGPSPMDRAVATRHVRPPGAMLARSDAAHPAVTRLYPEHGGAVRRRDHAATYGSFLLV